MAGKIEIFELNTDAKKKSENQFSWQEKLKFLN